MPEICGSLFWQFGGSTKIYFANTKFGRCGLLPCSRMMQGLPLCQRKSLKNQMQVWSTYWRAKPLTPRQVLRRYNKQTYKIFVRTCPTTEPHHWMTTVLLPPTCKFTYSCMTWTQLSSWNSFTCTFGTVHYLHADFWIQLHNKKIVCTITNCQI